MLIENPDAFKTWLTSVLEPLCEADPAALAKYVYALVKKDKPLDDLRDGMVDQLDVFLQQETKPFVDLLFKTLETQEYLSPIKTPVIDSIQVPSPSLQDEKRAKSTSPDRDDKAEKENDDQLNLENKRENNTAGGSKPRIVLNRTNKFVPATVPKEKPAFATEQTLVKVMPDLLEDSLNEPLPARAIRRDKKSDSDKEDRRRRVYRSRSRSWERNRRPLGVGNRGGGKPMWRNRSPPPQQSTRYRRSRSGSPPLRGPRYRNVSPPGTADVDTTKPRSSRSRSRERISPTPGVALRDRLERVSRERERQSRADRPLRERSDRERERLDRERERDRDRVDRERDRTDRDRVLDRDRRNMREGTGGADTPTQDSNPGDCTGQSRGAATTLAGIFTPAHKKRCRDFDEKGYCMRGDLCQFDHGLDPVVLEDANLSRVLLPIAGLPPPRPVPGYNPLAPDIWSRSGGFTAPPPPPPTGGNPPPTAMPPHHMQRELIPIPTVSVDDVRPLPPGVLRAPPPGLNPMIPPGVRLVGSSSVPLHMPMQAMPQQPQNKFDYNRLGGHQTRHNTPKVMGGNCSLELKKIPRGLNDILHLNNHFSKFGKIVNIQVCYEGDPEAAIITFSSHMEANVAYKSTEAVLNNRFIKVFWHNAENKSDGMSTETRTSKLKSGPGQLGSNQVINNKVLINKDTTKRTIVTSDSNKLINNNSNNKQPQDNGDSAATIASNNSTPLPTSEENSITNGNADSAQDKAGADGVPATINKAETNAAEIASLVKKRQEGRAKIVHDIRKRTQTLLDKLLQSQKDLFKRLEEDISPQQKQIVMDAIKKNQKCIDKTKEEYATLLKQGQQANITPSSIIKKPRSREETQKEILDAELDLFTKQQEGQDVTDLVKKVADLRRQYRFPVASRRGGIHQNYRIARKKAGRVATRAKFMKLAAMTKSSGIFTNQSVDHRPKSLLISGYESDEQAQVELHFSQFGEIVRRVVDSSTPSLWIHFDTRKSAEVAMAKGKHFNDRILTVTWVAEPTKRLSGSSPTQHQAGSMKPTTPQKNEPASHTETDGGEVPKQPREEHNLDEIDFEGEVELSEELLLQDDEEEDEDTREDRSWRR